MGFTVEKNGQPKSRLQRVLETAGAIAELAALAVIARGPLRRLDLFALGLKSVHTTISVYRTWQKDADPQLHAWFTTTHCAYREVIPFQLTRLLFAAQRETGKKLVAGQVCTHEGKITEAVYEGEINGVRCAWIEHQALGCQYAACQSPDDLRRLGDVVREQLWAKAGSDAIRVISHGIDRGQPVVERLPGEIFDSLYLQRLETRVTSFLQAGGSRCYLLEGEPGSGKSTAALVVARRLGLRTVIIDAGAFSHPQVISPSTNDHRQPDVDYASWLILRTLRPGVLILNDLDYLPVGGQTVLLADIEQARSVVPIIFVTSNDRRRLIPAVRRPGRIDELIEMPGCSPDEVDRLIPELAARRQADGWPIAHLLDVRERCRVLGAERAALEIEEVGRRLAEERVARVDELT